MTEFTLVVLGSPRGKGRPRFVRATGRTYTDAATTTAEHRIQGEWIAKGRPYLTGALRMKVTLYLARPHGHFKVDGSLSKAGQRAVWPLRTPDCDNALKLVADSLNGLAYRDDKQIVEAIVERRWAPAGASEGTTINVWALEPQEHGEALAA